MSEELRRFRYDVIGWQDGTSTMELSQSGIEITFDLFYTRDREDLQSHQLVNVPATEFAQMVKDMIARGWIEL